MGEPRVGRRRGRLLARLDPQIHPYSAGAAGLVTHLPTLWWLGLVLVVAAVIVELLRESPRLGAMVVCIVAVALVLHGTLPASEVTPRFDSAYDIAGFADYIGRFGRTLPYDDARMSWPAMMSATGMLARAMHVQTLWFVRWAPLVLNLAYLVPIKAIANVSLRTRELGGRPCRYSWPPIGSIRTISPPRPSDSCCSWSSSPSPSAPSPHEASSPRWCAR